MIVFLVDRLLACIRHRSCCPATGLERARQVHTAEEKQKHPSPTRAVHSIFLSRPHCQLRRHPRGTPVVLDGCFDPAMVHAPRSFAWSPTVQRESKPSHRLVGPQSKPQTRHSLYCTPPTRALYRVRSVARARHVRTGHPRRHRHRRTDAGFFRYGASQPVRCFSVHSILPHTTAAPSTAFLFLFPSTSSHPNCDIFFLLVRALQLRSLQLWSQAPSVGIPDKNM
jgi:hypothetical protein